jgi:hypothetical protein
VSLYKTIISGSYYSIISISFSALAVLSVFYICSMLLFGPEYYEPWIAWMVPLLVFPMIAILFAIVARTDKKDKVSKIAFILPVAIYFSYFVVIMILRTYR